MGASYQYFRDYCVECGKDLPKREMNKIMISFSHSSVTYPRVVCNVCDDCLPALFDKLGVPEPNREIAFGAPPPYCSKCGCTMGKTARYCRNCGHKLKEKENADKK